MLSNVLAFDGTFDYEYADGQLKNVCTNNISCISEFTSVRFPNDRMIYKFLHSLFRYHLGRPHTSDFNRCDYRAAQMKHMVLCGSARTGDYLIVAIKIRSVFHFQGDTIVAGLLLVRMKHTEINGCARTTDYRHLISVRNQNRPRPYPCGRVILTQRTFTVMAFKEVHDCEMLISEIEKVLLSMIVP